MDQIVTKYSDPLPCDTCDYALKPIGKYSRTRNCFCEKYPDLKNMKPNGVLFGNEPCEFQNNTAQDGGPGSGNFGHRGRPGKVGGSGPGGGSSSGPEPNGEAGSTLPKPRKTKSGEELGKRLREKYKNSSDEEYGPKTKSDMLYGLYGQVIPKDKMEEALDRYISIVELNGDPTPGTDGKRPVGYDYYKQVRNHGPYSEEEQIELLEKNGYSHEEAQKTRKELVKYTSEVWEGADEKILDEYIERRQDVFKETLYRGIHLKKEALDEMLTNLKKGVVSFGRVSSWTNRHGLALAFCDTDKDNNPIPDDETPVLFVIYDGHNRTGVPVVEFSKYFEGEVLTSSKTQWTVLEIGETEFYGDDEKKRKGYKIKLMERGADYDE